MDSPYAAVVKYLASRTAARRRLADTKRLDGRKAGEVQGELLVGGRDTEKQSLKSI